MDFGVVGGFLLVFSLQKCFLGDACELVFFSKSFWVFGLFFFDFLKVFSPGKATLREGLLSFAGRVLSGGERLRSFQVAFLVPLGPGHFRGEDHPM